jgi:hypothetical protein
MVRKIREYYYYFNNYYYSTQKKFSFYCHAALEKTQNRNSYNTYAASYNCRFLYTLTLVLPYHTIDRDSKGTTLFKMPRFGFGFAPMVLKSPPAISSPPPVGSPPFSSPGLLESTTALMGPGRIDFPHNQNGPSVRLCCMGDSGRTIYSLGSHHGSSGGSGSEFFLERRILPLSEEVSETQKARLPEMVQTALELSPPVELLCVDLADNKTKMKEPVSAAAAGEAATFIQPCLLCLYSRKDVFYLEMKIDSRGGVIVEAKTVFDNYFLYAGDEVTIVRIRPAPQRRMDFATLCPRGAMAMLTNNPYSSEYSLVLQHNKEDDLVSVPLSFQLEESSEMGDCITDFCFAQSGESKAGGLSLLSTLSVLLLKGSGQVHAASPILFDGSVVSKSVLLQALGLLEHHVEIWTKETPKGRRARAARMFFKDAFGDPHGPNKFLTARVCANGVGKSAVSWPVALQGPILTLPSNESFTSSAVSLENFEASDLIGVAIAHDCHVVDLGIISPSCLLPRFGLESTHDGYELDDALADAGACVQRLVLSEEEPTGAHIINQSVSLVRDRIMDSMLHYVTPRGVTTLHTTAPRLAIRKIEGTSASSNSEAGKDITPHSAVWSSVNATSARVQGVVIGDEPRFGHALFVRLSDGKNLFSIWFVRCAGKVIHLVTR